MMLMISLPVSLESEVPYDALLLLGLLPARALSHPLCLHL